jgi:RNA polymerase sigma-70 factor, ECF subfamily
MSKSPGNSPTGNRSLHSIAPHFPPRLFTVELRQSRVPSAHTVKHSPRFSVLFRKFPKISQEWPEIAPFSSSRCKPRTPRLGLPKRMEPARSQALPAPLTCEPAAGLDDFEALVRTHRPRVFRFILASLRDRETAENLTQDCFIRAYRARDQFRGASSVVTWILEIAANLVRSHQSSGRLKFWRHSLQGRADVADLGNAIPDRGQSPEAAALVHEQVNAIWTAAGCLPARQREVFLLRFVEDMSLLEIAEVTGMKEGTVKTHLFRALETVRARLEATR